MASDDPSQYNISRIGKAGLPIFIPWQRERRPILSGFDSASIGNNEGPWKPESPFSSAAVLSVSCRAALEPGTARDVEGCSSTHSTSSEHLSGRLGVSVGNVAAKVGVTASYDQDMQARANTVRASPNSRLRCGQIIVSEYPAFSDEAKDLLRRHDGQQLFSKRYGDYFVAGYVLGADSGACLASSEIATQTTDKVTVSTNMQLLWADYTDETSTTDFRQSSDLNVTFHEYDTLDNTNKTLRVQIGDSTEAVRYASLKAMARANNLHTRLMQRADRLGITNNKLMSAGQCSGAVDAGVVIELILSPFRSLKGYFASLNEGGS